MLSSLTMVLSNTLGYSPHLPESVCGTVRMYCTYEAFLGSMPGARLWLTPPIHVSALSERICLFRRPTRLDQHPTVGGPYAPASLLSITFTHPYRNINLFPINYAFLPRLRDRLTLRRLALRRNPWTYGGSVSHAPSVTHVSIRTSDTSRGPHGSSFAGLRNAPLPLAGIAARKP